MFFGQELSLVVVCIIVILGRIVDMSLATIRTVFSVKSKPAIAACIGFVEAFFWFIVVKAALDFIIVNPVKETLFLALSYSLGFSLGTFLGGILSKIFVKSKVQVQLVLSHKNDTLVNKLKEKGYGQTVVSAFGANHKTETYLIFIETDSKNVKSLKQIVSEEEPKAFISINESKQVVNGYGLNRK